MCECQFPNRKCSLCSLGLFLTHCSPLNLRIAAKDVILPAGGGPDGQAPLLIKAGEGLLCAFSICHTFGKTMRYHFLLKVANPKL